MAVDTLRKSPAELAQQLCQAAQQCLSHLRPDGPHNQALLEKASDCFLAALDLQVELLDAYLGLAVICGFLKLTSRGLDLLNQAQQLQPQDPRIPVLRKELQALLSPEHQRLTSAQSHLSLPSELLQRPLNFEAISPLALQQCDAILSSQLHFLHSHL